MTGLFSVIFKANRLSASVVGAVAGLVVAVPAGAGDWSSSLLVGGMGQHRLHMARDHAAVGARSDQPRAWGMEASIDQDYGHLVLGGSYQQGRQPGVPGLDGQEDSQQLQLRAGYDFGRALGYLTVGERQHGTGAQEGRSQVYGIGLRVSVNRVLQMSGEILRHAPSAPVVGQGEDDDILSVRAAFRF